MALSKINRYLVLATWVSLMVGSLTACEKDVTNPLAAYATPTPVPAIPSNLAALVETYGCANCHYPAGSAPFMDLTSPEKALVQWVNVTATQGDCPGTRVIPGDAVDSVLIKRLEGTCSPQMPYGGPYLGLTEVQQFKDWINAGAKPQ